MKIMFCILQVELGSRSIRSNVVSPGAYVLQIYLSCEHARDSACGIINTVLFSVSITFIFFLIAICCLFRIY